MPWNCYVHVSEFMIQCRDVCGCHTPCDCRSWTITTDDDTIFLTSGSATVKVISGLTFSSDNTLYSVDKVLQLPKPKIKAGTATNVIAGEHTYHTLMIRS